MLFTLSPKAPIILFESFPITLAETAPPIVICSPPGIAEIV